MPRLNAPCAAALVLLTAGSAQAKDLFDLAVTVGSGTAVQSGETSASTITDIINQLQTQNLNNLVSSYSEISAATATLNIRGVTAFASYPANSTALRFQVPAAGVDETFTGATRNDSENQLKDFLLKNGGGMATRLLQEMVAASPIDPVAGNPNSLENVSARNDFTIGTGIGISGFEIPGHGPAGGLLGQPNLVSLGGDVGVANSGGYTSTVVTLPLRYTIPFRDPRYALTFDLPITYVSTQGAASYFGSFGVSLRIPVPAIDNWYITPSIRTGAAGSIAVGAAALQYGGGVASRYDFFLGDLTFTLGNAVSIVRTGNLSFGSVSVNYDLTNELFTNGLQVEGSLPLRMFGNPTSWQAYVANTQVTGSKVYVSNYTELGFNVGTRHGLNGQNWDSLRFGVGLVFGEHYNAYKLALSYHF